MAAPRLGSKEAAASRARGGGRGGPGITWAEAGPGAPGELSLESDRRLRWNSGGSSSSLPPFFPSLLPFPGGLGHPAGQAGGSQVSARPPAPSAGHRPRGSPSLRTLPSVQSSSSLKPPFGLGTGWLGFAFDPDSHPPVRGLRGTLALVGRRLVNCADALGNYRSTPSPGSTGRRLKGLRISARLPTSAMSLRQGGRAWVKGKDSCLGTGQWNWFG